MIPKQIIEIPPPTLCISIKQLETLQFQDFIHFQTNNENNNSTP